MKYWSVLRAAASALIITGTNVSPARAQPIAAGLLPPCPTVLATLTAAVDSATANVGDRIRFVTIAAPDGSASALPAGLTGYGLVAYVQHARRAMGGELSLEARYVVQADGRKVPVTFIAAYALTRGTSRNAPGIAGAVGAFKGTGPAVASGLLGAYGFLHYGAEAVIPAATSLQLVVGDGIDEGTCSVAPLIAGKPNYVPPR